MTSEVVKIPDFRKNLMPEFFITKKKQQTALLSLNMIKIKSLFKCLVDYKPM